MVVSRSRTVTPVFTVVFTFTERSLLAMVVNLALAVRSPDAMVVLVRLMASVCLVDADASRVLSVSMSLPMLSATLVFPRACAIRPRFVLYISHFLR